MTPQLDVVRGKVTTTGSRMTGGHIALRATHAELHATPELWLADETGKEHHFRGWEFDNARADHEMIVIRLPGNGKLVQVRNVSTDTVVDGPALNETNIDAGGNVGSFLSLAVVLFIPGFLVWLLLITTMREVVGFGTNDLNIAINFQVFVPLWAIACFLVNAFWVRTEQQRGNALRKKLVTWSSRNSVEHLLRTQHLTSV